MTTSIDYTLQTPDAIGTPLVATGADVENRSVADLFLGCGITRPLRRDQKGDFAHACEVELVKANIAQILGTLAQSQSTSGELPWRPEFGSLLGLLRHMPNDEVLEELARTRVIEAVNTWEPRARIKDAVIERGTTPDGGLNVLEIKVLYDVVSRKRQSAVLVENVLSTFKVGA